MIHYSKLKLLASFHHTLRTIRRAVEYMKTGVIRVADFVGREWSLEQLLKLFQAMASGNQAVVTLIRVQA